MARNVHFQIDLDAPIQQVWNAWTTQEGLISFFAPAVNLDLRPGGAYEIFFNPNNPPGTRGAEGMTVLAFQAPNFLAFTWNAPPTLDKVRDHLSHVSIRLEALNEKQTRLDFKEDGFGEGGQWEQRVDYFLDAWGAIVLPRLALRFAEGPVDWSSDIDLEPYKKLVKSLSVNG